MCRTAYGHFLSDGKWDEKQVFRQQLRKVFEVLSRIAKEKGTPLYLSIDDTAVKKKRPSAHAKRPMKGAGWHSSLLEGKQVHGCQIFGSNISVRNISLCYNLLRCCKRPVPPCNGGRPRVLSARCEGELKGIENAAVLLSYPRSTFGSKKVLSVFICSDISSADEEILSHYTRLWKIEVMFKHCKMYLG